MEILYDYELVTPSGYIFHSVYSVRKTESKTPISGTLYVGNPKRGQNEACTTISINYPDALKAYEVSNGRPLPINPKIASLILTKYYAACAENMNLPKGKGTKEMILSSLSFVKKLCPFVEEFDLNDASSKECDTGGPISLPYFYITQKWQTWYEGIFNAYLKPVSLYKEYRDALKTLQETALEPFEIFKGRYLFGQSDEIKKTLNMSYEKSKTVGEFFKTLYSDQKVNMTCMLIQPWIDRFMRDMKIDTYILYKKWYIHKESIPVYNFKNKNNKLKIINKQTRRKTIW